MTERDEVCGEMSDTYKDAYGIRPRWAYGYSIEEMREVLKDARTEVARQIQEERDAKAKEAAALLPAPSWTFNDFAKWVKKPISPEWKKESPIGISAKAWDDAAQRSY